MQIVIMLLCLAGFGGLGWLVGYGVCRAWKAFLSFLVNYCNERMHR